MWFVKTFGFLGILALFTIATHGLAEASPGCVANYQNPYYEQARLWVRWQALALRSVAASHSNYGLLFTIKLCVLLSWCALILPSFSTFYICTRRCFKRSVLHALLRFTLLHKSHGDVLFTSRRCLCASRRYFALTKAVLHASCSSRRCCVLFKTLLLASRSTCSKLQATTTSHSY